MMEFSQPITMFFTPTGWRAGDEPLGPLQTRNGPLVGHFFGRSGACGPFFLSLGLLDVKRNWNLEKLRKHFWEKKHLMDRPTMQVV